MVPHIPVARGGVGFGVTFLADSVDAGGMEAGAGVRNGFEISIDAFGGGVVFTEV